MSKAVLGPIVLCLVVAVICAVGLLDPRDTDLEKIAKGVAMLGMLMLALSLARDARRTGRSKD